tara:strand:+ start:5132 stop:5878 length:747 start_codon:yes stop_codon:yes gene_type:complete
MKRKDFIKGLGLAGLSVSSVMILSSCSTDNNETLIDENKDTTDSDSETSDVCTVTPTETEGPFPTHSPADYIREDIVGDRTGIALELDITIRNVNNNCAILEGALVDIWHCDKDGNYSEYGGSGMQSTNYTSNHFLRGRQTTNSNGLAEFTSIFPGWYNGRSTHIHVHIYNSSGNSLLVTQIAFPEGENSAVVRVNAATDQGYIKGMSGYTYNSNDNVFSDGVDEELASVSGSVSEGFKLVHDIYVKA